jgi:hypothetical protein
MRSRPLSAILNLGTCMNEPVTLRFRYTQEDYVRAMRLHLSRRMRLEHDIVVAVVLGLLSAFMLHNAADPSWFWVFAGVASLLLRGPR